MKNLGVLLLIISLIFAGLVSFSVYKYLDANKESQKVEEIKLKELYVAKVDIEENTKIVNEMIETINVPEDFDVSIYITEKEEIINKFAYSNIIKGEGFAKERLISKDETKLITKLKKGERAVSISVTQYRAVADLMKPGDLVDIFVYLPEKIYKETIVREDITKLLLQKIKILAIRQEQSRNYDDLEKTLDQYAITLAVNVKDIEKIILSENIGSLKLALRPIDDNETVVTDGEVWKELLLERDIDKEWLKIKMDEEETSDINEEVSNVKEYETYIVKYGDTLMNIAREFYNDETKYVLIKEANNIGNNNVIVSGETLKIPVVSE
ncbi:MAG: Flp pilus assembly protein CpaB [Bacillota bacterium]|nr:Flp pilus assembly protein CpaB [Bacillota bacterium]